MKAIKAYVRKRVLHNVITSLERDRFQTITVEEVSAIGTLADPVLSRFSNELEDRVSTMMKIELECEDKRADRAIEIIRKSGNTDLPGDGMVLVTSIDRAVSIQSGEEGEQILDV